MAKKTVSEVNRAMGIDEYKPSLELDEKMYPELKSVKIDDVIEVSLKVKITRVSRDRWNNNRLSVSGTIENASPEKEPDADD